MQKKIDAEPAKETVKPTYRSFRTQYLEIHHALGRNKSAFFYFELSLLVGETMSKISRNLQN